MHDEELKSASNAILFGRQQTNEPITLTSTAPSAPASSSSSSPLSIHSSTAAVGAKLFIGQIPKHMNEADLLPMFQSFGDIYEFSILQNEDTGTHRGEWVDMTCLHYIMIFFYSCVGVGIAVEVEVEVDKHTLTYSDSNRTICASTYFRSWRVSICTIWQTLWWHLQLTDIYEIGDGMAYVIHFILEALRRRPAKLW